MTRPARHPATPYAIDPQVVLSRSGRVRWHHSASMRPILLLLVVVALHAGETDKLVTDQWFVGDINNQPSMTMHAVVVEKADGTSSDRVETDFLIRRTLGKDIERLVP